ncbi:DNA-binding transcriptional activator CaiF [Cedecea davisae]|uniref:Transcriptional activatory protein CaiF n=1 Tax=Cedecea davisae DSM 4568 TaxID=566551 RepID=S3K6Q7_9ENTR|nr:carnitine metabolism transcriptional regulator CaiF [Cedecea davisae]EPF20759.1 transcriptional activatory protein CaiF [Cedecea davisae DSM 4568]SUX36460.1 DNA-binding transcriptional activator CaiF [Cedecea davisae]
MCDEYVEKPLYLLISEWVMAENRWVSAKEIAKQFNMDYCKAINTVSYILAQVKEISCETRIIPNKIEGRGCQCHRLVRVTHIDERIYLRAGYSIQDKMFKTKKAPPVAAVPPEELNREQKWKIMLSKSMRR